MIARALASALLLLPALLTAQTLPAWQMQDSGTNASLRGIESVDGTIAWASGTGGTVLKTTNGGHSWQHCAIPGTGPNTDNDGATLDFRGVQAWDAETAIVMASGPGDKSRLYNTSDGCKTWQLILKNPDKDGFWDAFQMDRRGRTGILLGDPVAHHFALWEIHRHGSTFLMQRSHHAPRAHKGESAFAASNSSLFGEDDFSNFWIASGGSSGVRIRERKRYEDDGFGFDTFKARTVPVGHAAESSGIFSLGFLEHTSASRGSSQKWTILAVGGDYTKPSDSTRTAAYSLDSGQHWTAASIPPHGYRSTVQWDAQNKLWITAGTNGSDVSRDDGRTWQKLDDGNWNALSLPFAVGANGRIARLNPAALGQTHQISELPAKNG
ncbi:hypothetical protein ACOBR2_03500 [Telmatobacter bradus]|uniref:WD40/YVTN/BNR-like repeat-containing protein n=1 Tax=Telmatobacter bradus TaxID=474953 RepID=UPI003B437600